MSKHCQCDWCGTEMKKLFVYDHYSPTVGSFYYVDNGDYVGLAEQAVEVMWCPECGQIRGYLYKLNQEEQ